MLNSKAEGGPTQEEPGNFIPPEGNEVQDQRDQDHQTTYREKTSLVPAMDATHEHDLLSRLLAGSEGRCRE